MPAIWPANGVAQVLFSDRACRNWPSRPVHHRRRRSAIVMVVALLSACVAPATSPPSAPATASGPTQAGELFANTVAVAYLANNRIALVPLAGGADPLELELSSGTLPSPLGPGHRLGVGEGNRVFALASRSDGAAFVAELLLAPLEMSRTHALPRDTVYRSLAVGSRSGNVFVFGESPDGVVARRLDIATGIVGPSLIVRSTGDGRQWMVYEGLVSQDEDRLYVSYHGPDTTGVDWIDLVPSGAQRCAATTIPGLGCLRTHGGIAVTADELFATNGEGDILVFDHDGIVRKTLATGLEGNHLMEFELDTQRQVIRAVGSCGYTGGLAAVPLQGGSRRVIVPPRSQAAAVVCGERLASTADGSTIVLAATRRPTADPAIAGTLQFVDAATGALLKTVSTSAEAIDVVVTVR